MRNLVAVAIALAAISFTTPATYAGFGGSRSFSSGRSSFGSSSHSSSSSFGGSRSSGGSSSSFGGSRSGSTGSSSGTYSRNSTFGGSRSSRSSAPIVRPQTPSSSSTSTTHVYNSYHNYGGYGGGYYGGSSFYTGFMWGQFFNRPQVVYVGGTQYVQGPNGQPMLDDSGQPIVYQAPSTLGMTFAVILWLLLFAGFGFGVYYLATRES